MAEELTGSSGGKTAFCVSWCTGAFLEHSAPLKTGERVGWISHWKSPDKANNTPTDGSHVRWGTDAVAKIKMHLELEQGQSQELGQAAQGASAGGRSVLRKNTTSVAPLKALVGTLHWVGALFWGKQEVRKRPFLHQFHGPQESRIYKGEEIQDKVISINSVLD